MTDLVLKFFVFLWMLMLPLSVLIWHVASVFPKFASFDVNSSSSDTQSIVLQATINGTVIYFRVHNWSIAKKCKHEISVTFGKHIQMSENVLMNFVLDEDS